MITSISVFGDKLYETVSVNTLKLSSVSLQGYNFDKLQGVVLSSTNTSALPSLTSIEIFKRQPPISGYLSNYTVIDKNNLVVNIPRFLVNTQIQIVPFNIAGYSESSRTLISPSFSAIKTLIDIEIPVIVTYRRPLSTGTYRRPGGDNIYLRS